MYHYHLHVVYVPVVQKEIYFKKNNKDPELAGKLKEVIKQVSHSKKWPKQKQLDENGEVKRNAKGKPILVNAYSLLQDHFFQHMKDAGFLGFERGERGSTAEHLSVLEYKTQQETERTAAMTAAAEKKAKQVSALNKKIDGRNNALADLNAINKIGESKNVFGQIVVAPEDLEYVKAFASEGVRSRVMIADLTKSITKIDRDRNTWKTRYERLSEKAAPFLAAVKHAPQRVMDFLNNIMREPPERNEPERKRSTGLEL